MNKEISRARGTAGSVLSWLTTPFFIISFLSVLLCVEALFRLRFLFGEFCKYDRLYGYINSGILWSLKNLAGLKFSVNGSLPETNQPLLVVSNHQSMFDIPFLNIALAPLKLRFVAKTELAKGIPAISRALREGGHALIDRSQGSQAVAQIEKMVKESLTKNFTIALFPEGTRAKDGKLQFFRPGGLEKIVDTLGEVDVLPVAISGSWKITRYNMLPLYYGAEVRLKILDIIKARKEEGVDIYGQKIRDAIAKAVE